jgi:hypothetical protein
MLFLELERYAAPKIVIVECSVERGFGNSLEDPTVDPEIDW